MLAVDVDGRKVPVNSRGFLEHFEDWDERVAEALAAADHLRLGNAHWEAIQFLRGFYVRYGVPASPHRMIHDVGGRMARYHCTRRHVKEMFPGGGCRQASRIAGLPDYYCDSC